IVVCPPNVREVTPPVGRRGTCLVMLVLGFCRVGIGDRVLIEETKPRSKRKCWELKEVLSH
ncbi:MAG: 30S ribosomal protein S17, partial [Verrucomicrobiota bacterium]